ncbi:MAG: 50S ribosomal protein L17 [Prevotella sp.]|nr:50S ribosomal protein L17 [Prevotella sp.]
MRHNKKFNHLGRTASHRHALLANMSVSLIMHKRITTTLAKAKALKKYVEPLITRAKNDTTNSRRVVFRYLQDKAAITELFTTVASAIGDRPGGYTRVIKLGIRKGDAAPIAFIELVDFDENMAKEPKTVKKTRRSRRSGAKAKETEVKAEETKAAEEAKAEETKAAEKAAEEVVEEVKAAEETVETNPTTKAEEPATNNEAGAEVATKIEPDSSEIQSPEE